MKNHTSANSHTVTQKCVLVFVTGLIFWQVSEGLFYGLVRPTDSFFGYVMTAALYSYAAWLFLIVVSYFNIRNSAALFLAGGFFGWMVEGVLISTMYGIPDMPFPLSIPVTGLSWHGLLTVMVGLHGTRLALRTRGGTIKLALFIGMFWGLWAATWRSADASIQVIEELFFLYACLLMFLFSIGHLIWQRLARIPLSFGKWEVRTAIILTTLWFLIVTVPQRPMAILVLPPLLTLMYFALKKNKEREETGSLLTDLADEIPVTRYLWFAIVPFVSCFIYSVTPGVPNLEYNLVVVMVVTGCIGTWAFIASLVKLHQSGAVSA